MALRNLAGNAHRLLSSRVTRPLSIAPAAAVTPRRSLNTQAADQLNPSLGIVMPPPEEGWEFEEDWKALYIKVDLTGLSKEEVEVVVNPNEENMLIVKPKPKSMNLSAYAAQRLIYRAVSLRLGKCKVEESTAEMNWRGVLTLTVPKVTNASDEFVPIEVN